MNTLVIASNPDPESLTLGVAHAFADAAAAAGSATRVIDLTQDGFHSDYTMADRKHYYGEGPMPADVVPYQKAMDEADVIAFVTPIYWYTMTAQMKGFFDRVICRDFAYDGATSEPLHLKGKTVRFLMLAAGTEEWYGTSGIGEALKRQIVDNTFHKYCGVTDVELVYVDRTNDEDSAYIGKDLAKVRQCARDAVTSAAAEK